MVVRKETTPAEAAEAAELPRPNQDEDADETAQHDRFPPDEEAASDPLHIAPSPARHN